MHGGKAILNPEKIANIVVLVTKMKCERSQRAELSLSPSRDAANASDTSPVRAVKVQFGGVVAHALGSKLCRLSASGCLLRTGSSC